jgi:hypothetical protein
MATPKADMAIKRIAETHSPAEVAAEVEVLRADAEEIKRLEAVGYLRSWCYEEDLRTEAYHRLTLKVV